MPLYRFLLLCVFAIVLTAFAGCRPKEDAEPFRISFALNTVCTVFLYNQAKADVYRGIFDRIHEIESRMSAFQPDSDIARINASAGIAPVRVNDDVFFVMERALRFAEISGGAFDPSVGPLVSLWGIMSDNPRVPSEEEINAVLPLVNWRNVELNLEDRSVFLTQRGMALDLGAIAKGYAADEAVAIVRGARLERALIDLGGNVITYGIKQDRTPWRIGLQTPQSDANRGDFVGFVSGGNMTVVTSGIYERYFLHDGVRYHHLFSPFDGYPARTGLLSTTIVSSASMDADALSTAIFVLGYERGRAMVESLEGVEAIFIFDDMTVRKTSGVDLTITDHNFRLLTD